MLLRILGLLHTGSIMIYKPFSYTAVLGLHLYPKQEGTTTEQFKCMSRQSACQRGVESAPNYRCASGIHGPGRNNPTYRGGILLFFQQRVSLERKRGSLGVLSCQSISVLFRLLAQGLLTGSKGGARSHNHASAQARLASDGLLTCVSLSTAPAWP